MERAAIQRCQQGDIGGLEPLIARYQVPALRLAYLLLGDRGAAEDVVQDSFLLAYRGIARFRLGQPFAAWLFRIVTNAARQQRRSARHRRETSLDGLPAADAEQLAGTHQPRLVFAGDAAGAADPAALAERAEERAALLAALATLPQKQREAVVLRYYCDYSDRQIAVILGCRPGTARQRLHAGRASLQQTIQRRYPWLLASLATAPTAVR